jgi:peptide/nickel transport system substrate-binding protein
MSPWAIRKLTTAAALALPLLAAACADNTLRVATHASLDNLDPIWTTAYITRTHGYLVYDTLFAMDENFEPKPQMVDTWTASDDKKVWTFTLRDGLKWSDGVAVTAEDCVASLERWSKRDGVGHALFQNIASLTAPDAKTIVMSLKEPNEEVLQSLAKMSSNVPFMMPKRVADLDPYEPIQDPTGSGPYMLKKEAWVPGERAVYVKNPYYVPRSDAPSLAAGAKLAKADEIDLVYYPDQKDAALALIHGDVDYFESPSFKLVPKLQAHEDIVVTSTDPLGNVGMVRFNTLVPPFNNPMVRRAVLMSINQDDYMAAALGDHQYWRTCYSVFPCGTSYATEAGNGVMKTADLAAARRALKESGYNGEPVVVLNPTDSPVLSAFTRVTVANMQQIGMNVQVEDMSWATLLKRRANRGDIADGGWSMFHTWWMAADMMDPAAGVFSGDPVNGWFGWPNDRKLEEYRVAFQQARTAEERKEIATKVQERVLDIGAFGVLGQFFEPVAFRKDVKGVTSPVQFFWAMSPE